MEKGNPFQILTLLGIPYKLHREAMLSNPFKYLFYNNVFAIFLFSTLSVLINLL